MTKPEILPETSSARQPIPGETPEAPHSWDPAGRKLPAAKLDWTECLPFHQVRGVVVAPDPERYPGSEDSGQAPD